MKNRKAFLTAILILIQALTFVVVSFAWFFGGNQVLVNDTTGETATTYFREGDGTELTPYIIDQPIHLYNLAWLQYLGKLSDKTYYFKVESDLDMTGITLPPIGTTQYPFIGNFDGQNHVISNLITTNALGSDDESIKIKPVTVTSLSNVNIVGFFGVLGDYNGAGTYSSYSPSINNFFLNNSTMKTQLLSTMVGVVAGYVNGNVSDVGVSASSVYVADGSTAFNSSITNNVSDFSIVGYATSAYRSQVAKSIKEIRVPSRVESSFVSEGIEQGWGGSIDMQSMYNRLLYFYNNSTAKNLGVTSETDYYTYGSTTPTITNVVTSSDHYKEYNPGSPNSAYGKATFSLYQASDYNSSSPVTTYLYLSGEHTFTKTITKIQETGSQTNISSYYISSSSSSGGTRYYLNLNGTTITSSTSQVTPWSFSNNDGATGYIFTVINSVRYYLNRASNTTVSLSQTATSTWTYSSGSTHIQTVYNGTTYNLYGTSSTWGLSTRDTYYVRTTATGGTLPYPATTTTTETVSNGVTTGPSYFPLNVISAVQGSLDYNPIESNTGYVISGSNYSNGSNYKTGDIRVSHYSINDIYRALNGTSTSATYDLSKLEILTRTQNSSGYVRISDSDNSANTSVHTDLSGISKVSYDNAQLNLQKYINSKVSLHRVLSENNTSNYIYGLHFMDAAISTSKLVTANNVLIDHTTYNNYQMPQDSIDFRVRDKGFINFFSGTYFPGNSSFFSLNQIFRSTTSPYNITAIKKISKIYGNGVNSDPFIYYYSDGTYSNGTGISGTNYSSTPLFDLSWISDPTMPLSPSTSGVIENAVYYFEIPCNDGEYALGSVSGKDGAYLMYLDISANSQVIDRTSVTEYIITTNSVYGYPLGVAFVSSSSETVNPLNSVAISLTDTFDGKLTLTKLNTTITITGTNSDLYTPVYISDDLNLVKGTDPPTNLVATPISFITDTVKQLTWIDYNTSTLATIKTTHTATTINGVTTYTTTANNGTVTTGSTAYNSNIDVSSLTTNVLSFSYVHTTGATINFSIIFTYNEYLAEDGISKYQNITGYTITTTSSENLDLKIITVDNSYTILVNGNTPIANGIISIIAS